MVFFSHIMPPAAVARPAVAVFKQPLFSASLLSALLLRLLACSAAWQFALRSLLLAEQ